MKFGAVPIDETEGAIVAHAVGAKGRVLKKGHVLTAVDVAELKAAGIETVVVARLEGDDVGEDAAALAIARAIAGPGIELGRAFTGRCNLFTGARGLVRVGPERLDRLNLVDEAVTVATLAPYAVAEPGQMVATVKIIPFALPRATLDRALAAVDSAAGPLVAVASFAPRAVGLVLTRLPGTKAKVLDGTRAAVQARLDGLGCRLAAERSCDHAPPAIAEAFAALEAAGCDLILAYGAAAITDRRDVIPAAVEAFGGIIVHMGMPVDPGNLLLLARRGAVPILGLPGCARSPKLNGFDWVLQRIVAGLEVTGADIMRMGAGGLLMETAQRGLARAATSPAAAPASRPRVAAIVLAAGQSRRMGPVNKLLVDVDGKPMVAHAVDAALRAGADPIVVVTGHQDQTVRQALGGRAVIFVHNPDHAQGLATSLARGIAALPDDTAAAIVCLGDMPLVTHDIIEKMIFALNPIEGRSIVVPVYQGKRGNPVLWDRQFFDAMRGLAGDVGARHLIGKHEDKVVEVACGDDAVLTDFDTPDALARLGRAAS
ncbi:MAG: 4-diphosphocytidyl-2C-methyl-D-erythritol kinase [Alphaproteobacteria bacterium]|nr:4-diphosphocytidyl-2C-methyl-D-erythritol kinase [Alphaproteobacteria bacterium]